MTRCRSTKLNGKVWLTAAIAVAVAMIGATDAMAHHPPRSCSGGGFTITVVAGPCPVQDNSAPSCAEPGPSTGIQYQVVGSPDVVATLATINNTVSTATGNVVYDACKGEPLTGIGKYSCQEQAIKGNLVAGKFWVVVDGRKGTIDTSIVAKKYKTIQAFVIEGFGTDAPNACVSSCGNFDPEQTITRTEVLKFKDCSVQFDFDLTTGEVLNAALTSDSDPLCHFETNDVGSIAMTLNGTPIGTANFGDGIIASGSASCTTRVIGGKVYTWGKPCP